jgi:hypothetical protein
MIAGPWVIFRYLPFFLSLLSEVYSLFPNPKSDYRLLAAVSSCLFSTFEVNALVWGASPPLQLRTRSFLCCCMYLWFISVVEAVWSKIVGLLVHVVIQLIFEAIWKEAVMV